MSGIIVENGHTITHNTKTGRYEIADLGGKVRAFNKVSQAKTFAKSLPVLPSPKNAAPEVAATPPTIGEAKATENFLDLALKLGFTAGTTRLAATADP